MKTHKVILTNESALKSKYGVAGLNTILNALKILIHQDGLRGLKTELLFLDNLYIRTKFGVVPVSVATDAKQNKIAVDGVYNKLKPDYILLLGSTDVIPHQDLKNPMFSSNDPDRFAFGDLPYACQAAYSQNPGNFLGPTRVVSRLPDIVNATKPDYIIGLIETAAKYKVFQPNHYNQYFGISAEIWDNSTNLSITNAFGNASAMDTIPPSNSNWPANKLQKPSHFINCHGAENDSHYYGQPASGAQKYPISLDATFLSPNNIKEGTIIAAECCYGAQLFDPSLNNGQMGISMTYLKNKAYAYFGSTTIAYGPSSGNDQADLICQYFFESIQKGASVGRAALEARQKFISTANMTDPSNIKTIAQYNLYADPSIVVESKPQNIKKVIIEKTGNTMENEIERQERRRKLFIRGTVLGILQPKIEKVSQTSSGSKSLLNEQAKANRVEMGEVVSFDVSEQLSTAKLLKAFTPGKGGHKVHVMFQSKDAGQKKTGIEKKSVTDTSALIATEIDGVIVSSKRIYSR